MEPLGAELGQAASPPPAIQLHPNAAEIHRRKVADLEVALTQPDICVEAGETLRGMIEQVVLTPDGSAPDGLRAELHGDLAVVLGLGARSRCSPTRA